MISPLLAPVTIKRVVITRHFIASSSKAFKIAWSCSVSKTSISYLGTFGGVALCAALVGISPYMVDVAELSKTEAEYFELDMERYRAVEDEGENQCEY